jgi:hypothetical protein
LAARFNRSTAGEEFSRDRPDKPAAGSNIGAGSKAGLCGKGRHAFGNHLFSWPWCLPGQDLTTGTNARWISR